MKKFLIVIIIFLLLIISLFLISRYVGTKGLEVKEYLIINNKLPKSFYGFKIVHFSDLNYGSTIKSINDLKEKVNTINPDIIVFTGNLILKDYKITKEEKDELINSLKQLESKYGNYYILGEDDLDIKILEDSNFKNINTTYDTIINNKFDEIYLGNIQTEEDYKFKILLINKPDNITSFENFDLVLSGHSLKRQINLPLINEIFKKKGSIKYYKEFYKVNDMDLYISSGIGTSKIKLRLLNKPSINFYRIVNK